MMTDENKNIDTFFSARLQNETIENEGWNMPSDDIWDAAKPKFIDRKKPKKRFLFWLLIPLLAFCLSVPLKLIEGGATNVESDGVEEFISSQSEKIKPTVQPLESAHGITENPQVSNVSQIKKEESTGKDEFQSDGEKIQLKQESINRPNIEFKNIDVQKSSKGNLENIESREDVILMNEEVNTGAVNKEVIELNEGIDFVNTKNDANASIFETVAMLPILSSLLISVSASKLNIEAPNVEVKPTKFIIPAVIPNLRNEIGISHSQLLINLILAADVTFDNGLDELNLSQNYFNANITGRKWLNKKWSLMTGIHYSNLDFDINFSVFDTLDRELMQFINEEFNDVKSRSTIGDQEADFVIDLKDGVDAQLGDILNIRGDLNQMIRAIQIPLFLDYHIYRRKMEYTFGMGVAIEYLMVSESPADFKIYRDSELISKPVNLPLLSENYIDGSIYIRSGMRYLISDQLNFGFDAKINLSSIIFSGLDVGVYYRWN